MNLENLPAPEPDGSSDGPWPSSARRVGGEIAIGGIGVSELAAEYGTPLYILDEDVLRARARAWKEAMDEAFALLRGADVYYAGKAFLCVAVAKAVAHEGLAVDACSEGELRTALAAGVPGSRIGMHGNNKSREEVELALRAEVGHFVVDSLAELEFVDSIARDEGAVASVMLRVTTGVHAGGHEYMSTAVEDQKFGLSIRYTGGDSVPPSPAQLAKALASLVASHSAESGIEPPRVSIEPGRNIAGPAGVTLYTVGTVKTVELEDGPRRYVSVDGGMSDNIRPALYDAAYTAALASRNGEGGVRSRVVGKHCESGDIVVRDVSLPEDLAAGDILAVPATGAYGRSMASNYNHLPRPGVVAVRGGASRWIVRRETVEDLLALDAGYLRRDAD